ncbi:MAG: hypothetical protein WKF58_14055 [Ilumatobacteraceae bacterium]
MTIHSAVRAWTVVTMVTAVTPSSRATALLDGGCGVHDGRELRLGVPLHHRDAGAPQQRRSIGGRHREQAVRHCGTVGCGCAEEMLGAQLHHSGLAAPGLQALDVREVAIVPQRRHEHDERGGRDLAGVEWLAHGPRAVEDVAHREELFEDRIPCPGACTGGQPDRDPADGGEPDPVLGGEVRLRDRPRRTALDDERPSHGVT